ncbi:cation:proton antiporter [bacterium]|nr:MAG: cation:proton antiporter [bacterium]
MSTLMQIYICALSVSAFLCLYRIGMGPTPPDRTVGIDILGTLVVGFCAFMSILTGKDFYMNIGISWALLSFVGTLALAKFLERRSLDE